MSAPLVVGTITGKRAWRVVREDGKVALRSYAFEYHWQPGVNKAICAGNGGWNPAHVTAQQTCHCGFYAYYRDSTSYHIPYSPRTVSGVIEGWGRTTIGRLGFRCEKARIVALVAPAAHRDIADEEWLTRQAIRIGERWSSENSGWATLAACMGLSLGFHGIVYGIVAAITVAWWLALVLVPLGALALAASVLFLKAQWRAMEIYQWTSLHPEWAHLRPGWDQNPALTREEVEREFPGVRCYDTLEEMLEHEEVSEPDRETRSHQEF